jgi:hypothetical protein
MGSQSFQTYSRGNSANEAYSRAVDDANDEYGHQQGYSGAINASAGFRDVTSTFKSSGKSLNQYINERMDLLTKHQGAECICVEEPKGNTNKIKTQVEHTVEKGTKKWILLYCVYEAWSGSFVASFDKKGDAVARARQHTEKTQAETHVKMEKKIEKGTPLTAKITYKKSTNEKEGKWVFYGWASC